MEIVSISKIQRYLSIMILAVLLNFYLCGRHSTTFYIYSIVYIKDRGRMVLNSWGFRYTAKNLVFIKVNGSILLIKTKLYRRYPII